MWCWRKLLRVSWTARRLNQAILKEIYPKYSPELQLQYFGHLMQRRKFTGKDPDAGKDWRQKEKGTTEDEMMNIITGSMDMSLNKIQEIMKDREACHALVHGGAKSQTVLSDWAASRNSSTLSKLQVNKVDIQFLSQQRINGLELDNINLWKDTAIYTEKEKTEVSRRLENHLVKCSSSQKCRTQHWGMLTPNIALKLTFWFILIGG